MFAVQRAGKKLPEKCLQGSAKTANNILRNWAKDKVQKSLTEALNRLEKPEEER